MEICKKNSADGSSNEIINGGILSKHCSETWEKIWRNFWRKLSMVSELVSGRKNPEGMFATIWIDEISRNSKRKSKSLEIPKEIQSLKCLYNFRWTTLECHQFRLPWNYSIWLRNTIFSALFLLNNITMIPIFVWSCTRRILIIQLSQQSFASTGVPIFWSDLI